MHSAKCFQNQYENDQKNKHNTPDSSAKALDLTLTQARIGHDEFNLRSFALGFLCATAIATFTALIVTGSL